jgi:type IX secretion system PorP/SprF family membrane protein
MMGRLKQYILLLLLASFMLNAKAQQTIQLSQYMFNGLAINPAYAGYKGDWTLNASSRQQWVGINDAPKTETISGDGLFDGDDPNVGVGFIATVDQLGPETNSSFYANYAYRIQMNDLDTKRLCFGIGVGVMDYSLDGSKFVDIDQGDEYVPITTESKLSPDFRVGAYYYTPNYYIGASVFNLASAALDKLSNSPDVIKPDRTVYFTAGGMIPVSDAIDLKPSFMVKEDFTGPTNIDLTAYLAFNEVLWVGGSYRVGAPGFNSTLQTNLNQEDAAAAIVQVYINDNFRIGYAYDFTTSKLASYQNGTHELSLSITFPSRKERVVSPRYF